MKKRIKLSSQFTIILLMLVTISCVPVKELSYFNDINDLEEPVVNPKTQKTIAPFDRLYIKVLSTDPQTSQIFNFSEEIRSTTEASPIIGYLVD
jgi:hypothetical protein